MSGLCCFSSRIIFLSSFLIKSEIGFLLCFIMSICFHSFFLILCFVFSQGLCTNFRLAWILESQMRGELPSQYNFHCKVKNFIIFPYVMTSGVFVLISASQQLLSIRSHRSLALYMHNPALRQINPGNICIVLCLPPVHLSTLQ